MSAKRFVFVLTGSKISGLITDGDVRRALINGANLSQAAKTISVKDFISVQSVEEATQTFNEISTDIEFLPVINEAGALQQICYRNTTAKFPIATPALFNEEFEYLVDAFLSSWISSNGKYIELFEEQFASYIDQSHGVSCSSGTSALHLALLALDIGPGDEVIVPNLTFAATINAVLHAGATPVILDVDETNWGLNPKKMQLYITDKTKAVIAVHLYGRPCSINELKAICEKHNLYLIEDCAEAHGAKVNASKVGTFSDISCFSFFANKIVTTGEGGMCLTNDRRLAEKMRQFRDHGMSKTKKYWHEVVGYNYRMTNLQAAIGLAQINKIDVLLKNRKEFANLYSNSHLKKYVDFIPIDEENVVWLASGLIKDIAQKEDIIHKLDKLGVETRPFFYPLHQMPIYKTYAVEAAYPVSELISQRGLSFPTYGSNENATKISNLLQNIA